MQHYFSQEEKKQLFQRLPILELSYEPKLHKKVYASLYYIIPKGPKALVWYTYWKEQNVCLLITLNDRGNYNDIKLFPASFSMPLALGTIMYGTCFMNKNMSHFTCEDIYYYKGIFVNKKTFSDKINLFEDMFNGHIGQIAYTVNFLIVGLPVMTNNYEEALELMDQLPYKTYGIGAKMDKIHSGAKMDKMHSGVKIEQYSGAKMDHVRLAAKMDHVRLAAKMDHVHSGANSDFNKKIIPKKTFNNLEKNNNYNKKGIFKVKADISSDIYHLYSAEDKLVSIAMIPTYKCSVMMNTLFRNIKENTNLDLLEESDDEEEFENTKIDKFVNLDKVLIMECVYLKKFQKWQPIKIVPNGRLTYFSEIN